MSLSINTSADESEMTISVNGGFDFAVYDEFRRAYEEAPSTVSKFVVDLHGTEYVNSSTLGMLLVFRTYVGGDDSNINIKNCSQEVRSVFTISNFDKLFTFA